MKLGTRNTLIEYLNFITVELELLHVFFFWVVNLQLITGITVNFPFPATSGGSIKFT